MTLTPAYGRDYKSKKELLADLNSGKDFVLNSFDGTGYVNLEQLVEMKRTGFQARYGQSRKVCSVVIKGGKAS
jgi:hypothetical protein